MNGWKQFKAKIFGTKDLASIGLGDILGSCIASIFWFYIAAIIEPNEYGKIHYFMGIAGMASYLALISTQNTMIVYTSKNVKIQATFYFIALIVASISSFILMIIFYRVDASLLVIGYVINNLAIGELLGKKLYSSYSKYVLTQKILTLVLGIGFYYAFGVDGIIYALVLSYAIFSVQVYRGFRESSIDFSLLRSRFGFIFNNYIINIISGAGGTIDKIIIVPIVGYAILGNYSLALQVITVLMILPQIFFKYLLPHDASGNQKIHLRKIIIIISVGITVVGVTLTPYLISTIFTKYIEAADAIRIMSVSVFPATITMLYTSKFLGLEKSKVVLVGSLISFIILITLIILLGSVFGIVGLAVAVVLSLSGQAVFLIVTDKMYSSNNQKTT